MPPLTVLGCTPKEPSSKWLRRLRPANSDGGPLAFFALDCRDTWAGLCSRHVEQPSYVPPVGADHWGGRTPAGGVRAAGRSAGCAKYLGSARARGHACGRSILRCSGGSAGHHRIPNRFGRRRGAARLCLSDLRPTARTIRLHWPDRGTGRDPARRYAHRNTRHRLCGIVHAQHGRLPTDAWLPRAVRRQAYRGPVPTRG